MTTIEAPQDMTNEFDLKRNGVIDSDTHPTSSTVFAT